MLDGATVKKRLLFKFKKLFLLRSGNMSENATWTMEQFEPYYNVSFFLSL